MSNNRATKNNDVSRVLFLSLFSVALFAILYLGLMYAWIVVTVTTDVPNYVIKIPLRQFFIASLIVAPFAYLLLNRLCRKQSKKRLNYRTLCMMVGVFMTLAGLIGMVVILPRFAALSHSGGLTPDFGHTLTYDNFTGALWLFFSLTGFIPYVSGYFATSKHKSAISRILLLFVIGVSVHFIGYSLYYIYRFLVGG